MQKDSYYSIFSTEICNLLAKFRIKFCKKNQKYQRQRKTKGLVQNKLVGIDIQTNMKHTGRGKTQANLKHFVQEGHFLTHFIGQKYTLTG